MSTPDRRRRGRADRALTAVTVAAIALFALVGIGTPLLGLRVFAGTDELVTRSPYVDAGLSGGPEQNYLVDDTWDTGIPNTVLFAHELRQGHFASWNPYISAGAQLGATPSYALLSPLTVPYYLLGGAWAPGYVKLVEIGAAVGCCFLFLRRLRLGRPAALVGGLAYATSAFLIVWTNFPQDRVAAFIPAVFWGIERLVQERRARDAAWLALAVAAMIVGGFPAITGYCLIVAGPYLLVRVLAEHAGKPARAARLLAGGAAAVLAGAALTAVQLLPFAAYMSRAFVHGRGQTPADHLSPVSLVTALAPYALGGVNPTRPLWYLPVNLIESMSYVGAAVLVLALAAVSMPRAARAVLPRGVWTFVVAATAAGVVVIYVGRWPLALLQQLPVLFSQNYVGRARSVMGFGIAVLAAVGFDLLLRRREARPTRPVFGAGVWSLAALAGGVIWLKARSVAAATDRRRHDTADRLGILDRHLLVGLAFLAAAIGCAALLRWGRAGAPGRLLAAALLPVLIAVQALTLAVPFWPRSDRRSFYPVTDTHRFLQAHLGHDRFAGTFNSMTMSADSALRLRAITGHAFVDERLGELVRSVPLAASLYPTYTNFAAAPQVATSPVLDRLAVRYFVTSDRDPVFGTARHAGTDGSTTRLLPDSPADLAVPGKGGLRAVGLTPGRAATWGPRTWLGISVRDATGRVVARGRRSATGMARDKEFWLPVAAETARRPLRATVTLHDGPALDLAGRAGRPAVSTVTVGAAGAGAAGSGAAGSGTTGSGTGDGLRLAYSGSAVIYQRLAALPRLRWAATAVVQPDPRRRIALMGTRRPAGQVVLATPAAVPSGAGAGAGAGAEIGYLEDGTDAVAATVTVRRAGYLVLADALQTGWAVTVDGRGAPLLAADHALVAVAVGAGRHTVAFRYVAPGHPLGAVASAGTALGLLGAVGGETWWRRRRPASRRAGRSAAIVGGVPPPAVPPATQRRSNDEAMTSEPYLLAAQHPSAEHPTVTAGAPAARSEANSLDVTIILPCYNEQDHVVSELERITAAMDVSGWTYELLVIDDKSTDHTLAVLTEALPRFPRMRLMPFQRNGGSGTARRIGSTEAHGRLVVWTDADMTYPNERIPEFVQYLHDHPHVDQVVGARTSEQGTVKFLRVPAKWVIRKIAESLADTPIPDLNSGLRAFRREVSLPYLRLLPPGFSCVTTLTLAFLSNQHTVEYLPIGYAKRSGTSKFHFVHDAYRYILQVLRMVMYFNPIKVLMPLSLWLMGLGGLKAVVDVVHYHFRITTNAVLLIVTGMIIAAVALLADLIVRSRGDT